MKRWLVSLVACLVIGTAESTLAQGLTAITGATVIGTGGPPIPDGVVIIDGGRITRVGPRATTSVPANAGVVDAQGKFVMPGLADMHNHALSGTFRPQQNLRTNLTVLLAFGVTTVFNPSQRLAEFAELKTAAAAGDAPLPRYFGTGPIVTVKGDLLGAQVGAHTPQNESEARATIKALKAAGVDAIKISRDDISWASTIRVPVMSESVLAALVDEAHREGLKAFVHAPLIGHAKEALRAGADGLLHGIIDREVDQELIDLMLRNRAVYVPTLSLYEDVADVASFARRQSAHDERQVVSPLADSMATAETVAQFQAFFNDSAFTKSRLAVQRANVKRIFDANVPVVMGTDSGFYGIVMGTSSQLELALMVEAGLAPEAALRAATINAARMLGREKDLGSVEPGKAADLLILDANPLDDVRNVRRIYRVVKGGVVHDPAQLLSGFRVTPRPAAR